MLNVYAMATLNESPFHCLFFKLSSSFIVVFIIFSTADNCFRLLVLISTVRETKNSSKNQRIATALEFQKTYNKLHTCTASLYCVVMTSLCVDIMDTEPRSPSANREQNTAIKVPFTSIGP